MEENRKNNLCNFLQTRLQLDNQNICTTKRSCIWATEFYHFKCIYFVLCNFGLKSYLRFQIKVNSTQLNYHYKSVKYAQKIISTLRCQNREESQLKSKFTANNTFCLIKFVHYFLNLDKKKQNDFTRYFLFRYCVL